MSLPLDPGQAANFDNLTTGHSVVQFIKKNVTFVWISLM